MIKASRVVLLVFGLAAVTVFAGCAQTPKRAEQTGFAFEDQLPITLDIAAIETENAYRPPLTPPNVEHFLPIPPAEAAVSWAKARLRKAGATRRLIYTVREASIIESALEKKAGLSGLVTVDQSERYDARLAIDLTLIGYDGRTEGRANFAAERSITVPEDASPDQREAAWFRLVEQLMQDTDRQLEDTIKAVFSKYVVRG